MLQRKSRSKTTVPKGAPKDASRSEGQGAVDTREADPNEDISRSGGQDVVDTREADQVRSFPLMIDIVTSAHDLLDATSNQSTPTRGSGGPTNSAHYFPFTYIVRLTMDQHQEERGYSTLALRCSITFPTRLLCFRAGAHDATIDPGD